MKILLTRINAYINAPFRVAIVGLGLLSTLFCTDGFAQNQDINNRLKAIIQRNIQRTKQSIEKKEQEIKQDVGPFIKEQNSGKRKLKGTDSAAFAPMENPLDKSGGHLDENTSWKEYQADSKIILNDMTFPRCMEPRLVAKGIGPITLYTDGLNKHYEIECKANCFNPGTLDPSEWVEPWQVISYYWPQYQLSVNKAGAQMIDPDIVKENRGTTSGEETGLYRGPTSNSEDTADNKRNREAQKKIMRDLGLPVDEIEFPDYHKSGKETHLQQDGEIRYVSAMRPNAMWRAANQRPPIIPGWTVSPTCLFNALDPTTKDKKVIANRFDQGYFAIVARYPETRFKMDSKRYKKTSPYSRKLSEYKNSTPKDFLDSNCASYRLGSNQAVYGDLAKVGFKPKNDPSYKEYCLPGGYSLSGSMTSDRAAPRLQADAARVVMAAILFSAEGGEIGKMNSSKKRLPAFTKYLLSDTSVVPRYVSFEINPGENKSNIVFLDKLQRIYPTQPMTEGSSDGVGGASSEGGQRSTEGQRGSQCFRPEDIPNWSSEGITNISEWPLGLVQDVRKHYGETRWAMWNRRVLCACAFDGYAGCLNQNSGDFKEDSFAGAKDFSGQQIPDPFTLALPVIKTLAEKKGPPSPSGGPTFAGFSMPAIDTSIRGSGPTFPIMPGGKAYPPPENNQIPDPLLLTCIPIEQQAKPSSQPSSQASGQPSQSGSNSPADPNKPEGANNEFYNSLTPSEQNLYNSYTPAEQQLAVQTNCIT